METSDVLKQFLAFNRTRIARLRELSPIQQQAFIELLPLIFHSNSATLPAFISDSAPAGISDYQPNEVELSAAQKFNHSFNFKRKALRHYPILGLYLINDHGGLQFPLRADFDLWLVHSEQVASAEQALLQQKSQALQQWATSLDINLTIRLFNISDLNPSSFTAHDLNRFYLNGLVLAGSLPAWWLVPPDTTDYQQAVQQLTQQRRLNHHSIIDFGELPVEMDPQPLFDLTYKQLNLAMEHGLEALLDLLYSQYCLLNYPQHNWLCNDLKHTVYQDEKNPLQIDSNLLKLTKLQQQGELSNERLLLVKQALYFLFKERLSQQVAHAIYPWRREFCSQLIDKWQWSEQQIKDLDRRSQATYRQCITEYEQLRNIVFDVSHSLLNFAEQHQLNCEQQIKQLRRKQQLHESAPDIIACLPPALLPKNSEQHLYLYRTTQQQGWMLNEVAIIGNKQVALYQADSLVQVLAWAIANQLLTKSTRLKIADQTHQIAINTILQLVEQLLRSNLKELTPTISEQNLEQPATIKQLLLVINLEHSPTDNLSQQGLVLSSLQSDPLNHAANRQSLIVTVEALVLTSWGQWHYITYQGLDSPLQVLAKLLQWQSEQLSADNIISWCPSEAHGQSISNRLSTLYNEVITHYKTTATSGNYFVAISEQLYQLHWQHEACFVRLVSKQGNMLQVLMDVNRHFSTSKVDSSIKHNELFNQLLRYQSPQQITLFLQLQSAQITIYIVDELGNLIEQHFYGLTESTLITHFYHFLNTIKLKNEINKLRFYRLEKVNSDWQVNVIPLQTPAGQSYLPVMVEMDSADDHAQCKIYCGQELFQGTANDKSVFHAVRELMLRLRKSHQQYPLYITKLTFSQGGPYTSNQYLLQKQRLEQLLNQN